MATVHMLGTHLGSTPKNQSESRPLVPMSIPQVVKIIFSYWHVLMWHKKLKSVNKNVTPLWSMD